MAWSATGAFRQTEIDNHDGTIVLNLGLETHKVALYGNAVVPDFDCTAAASSYGAGGTWTTGNEASGAGYTAGGALLTSTTVTGVAGGIAMWDAADVSWATVTVTAHGCLIYADALTTPVADQGIMAIYFGGAFQSTGGTFTIQVAANGLMRLDMA